MTYQVLKEIGEERQRQIDSEGWSIKHDDGHDDESLAMAAACYAAPIPILKQQNGNNGCSFVDPWPWTTFSRGIECYDYTEYNKERKPRRRQLVIAAALLIAEIERLDRDEDKQ